jgi:outer membrane protein assembly factor BamB
MSVLTRMTMRKKKWMLLILIPLILMPCCLSAVSGTTANAGADNWAMFRQNPSHTGTSADNSLANSARLLWNFTTMEGVVSSPAVADGYVFVGANEGAVYCLNSSSGKLVWGFLTDDFVGSSPAVYDGRVYFGCCNGYVYTLNETNGGQLWNYSVGGSFVPGPESAFSSPTCFDGVVYIGSYDGNVYALNDSDGAKLWNYDTGNSVQSCPAVSEGVVYASAGFLVYALNATSGSEIWSQHTGSTVSSPCVNDGYVYIGSSDGYACCLNSSTGAFIWKYQTQDSVVSSPALAYGCVYFGSEDNNVYCLNAYSGKEVWQSQTGYWVKSSPAVADGNVYVGSEDNSIYCFNASTGAKEWSYETGNFVDSSPAVADNTLYVGSDDNHVYAFALSYSTSKNAASPSSALPLNTIGFDAISFAIIAVAAFAVVRFVRQTRRSRRSAEATKVSDGKVSWFSAHWEALCVLAILAFSLIFYVNLGSGVLWVADEQTYSQWAFHMVKTGDYLTPWGNGGLLLWISKPPLGIWLMALSYQFLGVSNFAARLSSAVFGSLSLVLVFYLGKKLYNPAVGFMSALILGSFTTFYEFARRAMTDVPFVFFVLASVYFFLLSDEKEGASKYAVLGGLFFGLALMTKQVQALLIPLIIFAYLLATKRSLRFLVTKRFTLLWAVALLIFGPWLIYMWSTYGSIFWQAYFGFSFVSRTVTPIEGHAHGYLYYFTGFASTENVAYVVLTAFSAVFCLFNAAVKRVKQDTLVLAWMIVVLAVFTLAQTKLYYYILPAFPAFAIAISSLLYQTANKGYSFLRGVFKTKKQQIRP